MTRTRRLRRTLLTIAAGFSSMAAAFCAWRFGLWLLLESTFELQEHTGAIVRRIGIALSLALGYWVFVRYVQKRDASELEFRFPRILLGAASGAALIGVTISALFAAGYYQVVTFRDLAPSIGVAAFIFGAALLEELFFRGVVFAAVELHIGTVRALTLQSVLFAAAHFFNDDVRLVTMVNVTLIGALWTAIFVLTRNVWAITLHHAAWNFAIYASGAPLSGVVTWRESAPIEIVYSGPLYLTGGAFGPEDSVITTLVVTIGLGVVLWWTGRTSGSYPNAQTTEVAVAQPGSRRESSLSQPERVEPSCNQVGRVAQVVGLEATGLGTESGNCSWTVTNSDAINVGTATPAEW